MGIEEAIILVFITWLGFNAMIVKVIAQVVVIVLNYVTSKFLENDTKGLRCMIKGKPIISKLLIVVMLFGAISFVGPTPIYAESANYTDVENHWAQHSIERWSGYEIVNGNEFGEFLPDANMTRGQLAKVLASLLGLTEMPANNPFSDVPEYEWYTPFMLRCYEAGIMLGSDGMGMPDASVTRQETMVMIARALGIEPIDSEALAEYKDAANVDNWAAGYVAALIKDGIVDGIGDNALAPKFEINRASVMTVLDRSISQYIKTMGVYDLSGNDGIVLIVSGDVTLTGTTDANLIISPACAGKTVAFDGATVTGTITVQTDSCVISENNSSLSEIKNSAAESTAEEATKPVEAKDIAGGGSGGGGGGIAPSPTPNQEVDKKLEKIGLVYEAVDSKSTTEIKPQVVDGKAYMFLPSSADYSNIYFTASDTTELRGTVHGAALTTTASGSEKLDLTAIFGTMEPGVKYTMRVKNSVAECEIILMKGANIPSLHITLDESKVPNRYESALAYVHADKKNKLSGSLVMVKSDGSALEESLKQLKGRGNSTWSHSGEKRPYNIKLNSKKELIESTGAAKNWCLLSNNMGDDPGIANTIAYKTYEEMAGNFAIATQSVDLYIDNEYRGVYFLTEKVEVDEERVNIRETKNEDDEENVTHVGRGFIDDPAIMAGVAEYQYATNSTAKKAGGFLLEIDPHMDAASWFRTKRGILVNLKSPEFATKEQMQKIAIYFQEFEDALYSSSGVNSAGKRYSDYIDIDSWAKQYIFDCFTFNWDMMGASSFTSIDSDSSGNFSGKLIKGPAWDYNSSGPSEDMLYNNKIGSSGERNFTWVSELLKRGDFVNELLTLSEGVLKNAWSELNATKLQEYINEVESSQSMNSILYNKDFAFVAASFATGYARHYGYWYNTLWTDENLLGLTISENNGELMAAAHGTATGYQWYRCDFATPDVPVAIDGATTSSYTPTENGIYFVDATGGNLGYNYHAAAEPWNYTTDGVVSMVASPTITMHSNAIEVTGL